MPNLNDLINTQMLTGYVRTLEFPDLGVLDPLFPVVERIDNKWKWDTTQLKDEPAISYRALDTELDFGSRQGVSFNETELPFLGRKKLLTEEQRLRLEAIRRNGDYGEIIEQIYNDLYWLTRGAYNRWLLDKGKLLTTGALTVTSMPINGTPEWTLSVNYNVPNAHFVTASPLWSSVSTADPLTDLVSWEDQFADTNNGERPAEWLINQTVEGLILRNAALRAALYGPGYSTAPTVLDKGQVNSLLTARGLAPLRVVNAKATNEAGTKVNVIDQTKIVAVPDSGLANMATGVTVEALDMVEAGTITLDEGPGLVGMTWKENDPSRQFNGLVGAGMPVLQNPSLLFVATVR